MRTLDYQNLDGRRGTRTDRSCIGRASDGTLTLLNTSKTRGLGIGVDTDTQGPLRLSHDNRFLCARNEFGNSVKVPSALTLNPRIPLPATEPFRT